MTKSAVIHYNDADEILLLALFQKLKIRTEPVEKEILAIPNRVASEIKEGLLNIQQYEKGEKQLQDAYDLLEELKNIA
jgi:hypothetical protein